MLHYTSGTTGAPKGAMHVHGSIFAQYLTSKVVLDIKRARRLLAAPPTPDG